MGEKMKYKNGLVYYDEKNNRKYFSTKSRAWKVLKYISEHPYKNTEAARALNLKASDVGSLRASLKRKGFLDESGNITTLGREVLQAAQEPTPKQKVSIAVAEEPWRFGSEEPSSEEQPKYNYIIYLVIIILVMVVLWILFA